MRSCIFYYVVSLSCSVNSLYSMWATWRACRDKACTHCSAIHSGQLDRLKKGKKREGGKKKPCEKKSSTTGTEEVHNANSFPNTTDCFHHNEGKQPLLLSSTSTNNALTKPPNPRFCSQTKPPRPPKRSQSWKRGRKVLSDLPPPLSSRKKYNDKKGQRESESEGREEPRGGGSSVVTWRPSLSFASDCDPFFKCWLQINTLIFLLKYRYLNCDL